MISNFKKQNRETGNLSGLLNVVGKNIIQTLASGLFVAILLLQAGCSGKAVDETKEKQQRLSSLRDEMVKLKSEIDILEAEIKGETTQNRVSVTLLNIKKESFNNYVNAMGKVQSDKNLLVSPESPGNIISIQVKEGDQVTKGQVLARLNSDAMDRSIQEMGISLDLASTLFERQDILWKQNIGSEVQYLQAKSNKESLEKRLESLKAQKAMAVITSPVNGVVDQLIQKQGEMASPSSPFARVVNLENIYITADLSENYLNKVKKGDSVRIEFPVLEKTVQAIITRTSSVIDPDNRTFRVRVDLPNNDGQIRPNLMAVLKLRTYHNEAAIVVPSLLVKTDFTGQFLYVANKEDGNLVARKKYIESGIKDNSVVLISKGLEPGNLVITEGYAQVIDGTLIQEKSATDSITKKTVSNQ